jgi:hypothetical protein
VPKVHLRPDANRCSRENQIVVVGQSQRKTRRSTQVVTAISLIRLLVRFRRRRIDGSRRHGMRGERCFVLGATLDRRRPWPIDASRLDGGDRKSVSGSLQGHGALPSQAIEVDRRRWTGWRRLPCGHDQRGTLAIVRQRVRPQRQCNQRTVGQLRYAARFVARDAFRERRIRAQPRIGVRGQPFLEQERVFAVRIRCNLTFCYVYAFLYDRSSAPTSAHA